eukprot:1148923-Pelagomonas_calceolata.AAC.5
MSWHAQPWFPTCTHAYTVLRTSPSANPATDVSRPTSHMQCANWTEQRCLGMQSTLRCVEAKAANFIIYWHSMTTGRKKDLHQVLLALPDSVDAGSGYPALTFIIRDGVGNLLTQRGPIIADPPWSYMLLTPHLLVSTEITCIQVKSSLCGDPHRSSTLHTSSLKPKTKKGRVRAG